MKTIVCTTGTSIAAGVPEDARKLGGEAFRDAIRQRLAGLAAEFESAQFLERASAESNSVCRLAPEAGDRVVLLCSETEEGAICAEEVRRLLADHVRVTAECRKVDGLQATDATRFRRVGVQNLFAELDRHCESTRSGGADSVFLNVTGGFKSAVPYVTLYGLLHQVPVVYIFERSDRLFTLPQAPVRFDYDRLAPAADAIATLYRETDMPREEFFKRIPGLPFHERAIYEPLLDEENGHVMLSAFGLLLHEALQRDHGNVFLSPSAAKAFEDATGDARAQLALMLDRVGNPLIRRAKRHAFHGTDLEVYKPGNTAQRMAYFMRGDDVHVCELYPTHDEGYEKMLAGKRAADYENVRFVPWTRPAELPPSPATDEEWAVEQARRFARLQDRCATFERRTREAEEQALRVVVLEDEVAAARASAAATEARFAVAESERLALAAQVAEGRAREQALRDEALAEAAAADRVRRFASEANWFERLRFLFSGRMP
jgi:putative CRISPR-associated protein (TIGR02619 family)